MTRIKYIKFYSTLLLSILLIGCNKSQKIEVKSNAIYLKILGTIQDGGIPHMGCNKQCCKNYFLDQTRRIGVSSIGITNLKYDTNYLIDATPDVNFQLESLIGSANPSEKLNGIFLTHAHMGHYVGLLNFGRESLNSVNIPLYLMPKFHDFVLNNGPWNQLVTQKNVNLFEINADKELVLDDNLSITPVQVPHRDEYSETVGFIIKGKSKKALYIPDIDKWEKWNVSIVESIKNVDYAFLDGTFYDQKEINNRDMSEIPHPFVIESMKLFDDLEIKHKNKIYFIHLNHTNPLLNSNSKEYKYVVSNGYNVAKEGLELKL
ncbi:MAG: MBL fold metallo-hydrolase [Flavobacteriaceae bacterium]|nr:MBL fold metallo-hydrolase [Flavobacteriaceae bacterium]